MEIDHNYQLTTSPRKLKRELDKTKGQVISLKKKLKTSQQKSRRLKVKVKSLKAVVQCLKKKQLISSSCEQVLKQTFSGVPLALMKRMTSGHKSGKGVKYPPQLRSFALTLQFYSSKAYEFVRKTFQLALPHQAQIRRWYGRIPAEPGFSKPAFEALRLKAENAAKTENKVLCSLMMDEMAIRKHIAWDGKRFRGFVDLGNDVDDDDSAPVAKDALVFMVVNINGTWKVPCGYFLIDGLEGQERANLVRLCIQRLTDTGIKVVSLTCDGPSCHFKMLSELGAAINPPSLEPNFPNPGNCHEKIHVLLDVCHMLKLVRNTLAEKGLLVDIEGNKILWQYVVELQKLQEKEGLRLGNKLKMAHIKWYQQKMKVNLAAQTFSSSVADALEYCSSVLKLKQFLGSEATVKFIRIIDRLFDILNSRNPWGTGFKSAMRIGNKQAWEPFLDEAYSYILALKNSTGQPMHQSKRKTGFIGFLVAIRSIKGLFNDLVGQADAPLKYLLTYKFSQDHLELFFGAIRSSGGFNNNPTSQQFIAAYKRLFLRSSIASGKGNCQKQEEVDILHVIGDACRINDEELTITEASLIRKYDLELRKPKSTEHDYTDVPNFAVLSQFKSSAISYIAGYVGKMVQKKIMCHVCCNALGSKNHCNSVTSFLKFKDRGGLFKPTASTIKVCEESERCFQRMLASTNGKLPQAKGLPDAVSSSVLESLNLSYTFKELQNHMFDCSLQDNHVFNLIKSISKCYCKIRLHHLGKQATEEISGTKIRKKLSKLVLFKYQ